MPDNGLHARIVDKGNFRSFKISRLKNRYAQVEEEILDSFEKTVGAGAVSCATVFENRVES